jgi:hypothetical protein
MRARSWLCVFAAALAMRAGALTPPSASDGPIRLLGCTVSARGILEAQVINQGDDAMFCNIRCHYELGGKMFTQDFSETIPKHFQGAIGRIDAAGARAGNYPGELGRCSKVSD